MAQNEEPKKTDWVAHHKTEAANFVREFYQNSYAWRDQGAPSYHTKWDRWERNYNNIYDPNIKAQKKEWQSAMFVPYSVTNVEVITTSLFKLLFGKRESIRFDPRETGDELQAELHSDKLSYEMDMACFQLEANKMLKEIGIFGSSFMKFYWVKTEEDRYVMEPVRRGFVGTAKSLIKGEIANPADVIGMKQVRKRVVVEDRCRAECIHIRDIFLEPNSRTMDRVLHRQKNITFGELLKMSKMKNADGAPLVDPESVERLRYVKETEKFEDDCKTIETEKGNPEPSFNRTEHDEKHTCFEYWGPIPRKWVDLEMPETTQEEMDAANEMVPGKILVASANFYLASEENPNPIPRPPFVKHDYIDCGQTYGKGICQLIEGLQEQGNEITNLRIDNVVLSMNKVMVVIEKFLRDPNEVRSEPGALIRLKGDVVDDARKAVYPIEIPPTDLGGYRETAEVERMIQETTAANRVTIGTSGVKDDTNQTLGGMEILRQSAYERFAVYGYLLGLAIRQDAMWIMALSYQNSTPERDARILGEVPMEILPGQWIPRWQAYRPLPPHELPLSYDLKITDIFGMENRALRSQQMTAYGQLAANLMPGFKPRKLLERIGFYNDFKKTEVDEILGADVETGGNPSMPSMTGNPGPMPAAPQATPTGQVEEMGAVPSLGQ